MRTQAPRTHTTRTALMLAAAHAALLLATAPALAATDTWTGNGADGNWNNPLNWGGTAPVAGDSLIFSGTTRLATSNNFPAGTLFNSISFDSTAGNFTLAGNALLLGATPAGSIISNSTAIQTLTLGLTLSNLTTSPFAGGNHLINAVAGTIALNPAGGLQRQLGSTAQFNGNITTITLTNDSTGILGGWANFGASVSTSGVLFGTNLASVSAGQVVVYPNYTNITGSPAIASSPGTNYLWSGPVTPATLAAPGITDFNSLTFSDTTAATINMTSAQTIRLGKTGTIFRAAGGSDVILQIGNVAAQGTLTAGGPTADSPGELIFDANSANDPNQTIIVDAVITDNGTGQVTLVKTGMGAVQIQPGIRNTFTGDIYINQGKLRDQTAGAFGNGHNIFVANGAQAYFQTADVIQQNIFLSGLGVSEGGAFLGGAMRLSSNGVVLIGNISLTGDTRITARGATGTGGVLAGQISGNANLELGGATTGILTITNTANNWTGNTSISSGTTRLGNNEVLPSGAGKGNLILNADGNGGGASSLDLFGHSQTVNGLSLGANAAASNITNSSGIATLNVGANNTSSQFDGLFTTTATGTLTVNKIGSGNFTLTNASAGNFSGTLNAAAGRIIVNNGAGITANLSTSGGAGGGKLDLSAFSPSGFTLNSQSLTVNSSPAGGGVAGSININGSSTLAGTGTVGGGTDLVTLNGGGEIKPGASSADGSVGTLTLSALTTSGGDIRIDATGAGDKLSISGTATFNGASITVAPATTAGTYTILSAASLLTPSAPSLAATSVGRSTYALDFSTLNTIKLTVTGGSANLTWNNAAGGDGATWDIQNNKNFASTATVGNANQYYEADNVTFNDANAAHYNVTLNGTVNPASVTFSNSAGDYVLAGGGSIAGPTALTVSGSRSVTISNSNTYTGPTNLNNGTLVINNANAIGSGPLNINGGALGSSTGSALVLGSNNLVNVNANFAFAGPSDLSLGSSVVLLNANATINVAAANLTLAGVIANGAAGDGFTKTGSGTLILSAANTFSGPINITGGILRITNINALGSNTGPTNINGGTIDITNLVLNTTETFNIAGNGFNNQGAIINSAANQTGNNISRVNLLGNASIGGTGRWDFRSNTPVLELNGFNLTKVGTNQISLNNTTIRNSGLSNSTIEVSSGFLALEALTSTQGTNGAFQFDSNITLQLNANTGTLTWPMNFLGNNSIGNSAAGNATIASPMILKGNVTFVPLAAGAASPASTFPLFWNGSITESGGSFAVNKLGLNTTVLAGPASNWTGNGTLDAGILEVAPNPVTGTNTSSIGGFSGNGTLTVDPGAAISSGGLQIVTLNVNGALKIRNAVSPNVSKISAFTLAGGSGAWTANLDITNSKFIVEDSTNHATTLATTRDQVAFGKTHANGITDSTLPANMGIAVLDNAVLNKSTFGGVSVDAGSILVSQELLGDANADGLVSLSDLAIVLNHFGTTTPAWTDGNFDGATAIDLSDLNAVLNNFGATNPNASSAPAAPGAIATPEPASLCLLALAAPALLAARRKR